MPKPAGAGRLVALLIVVSLAAAVLFTLCYRYDNKYTAPGVQPVGGVLRLSEEDLREQPMVFLVCDWEIYRGVLLTPDDFKGTPPVPDELTFIGQYGGFEGRDKSASPHGSATYRLEILLPDEPDSYTLELPEIYSAYRLYLNGQLMREMGQPDPERYRPHTGNATVTLPAAGRLELLVAVSDYGYLYSGMVYPPAFGLSDAVLSHLNARLALRLLAIAAALCVGLIALGIRVLSKPLRDGKTDHGLLLLYALLCFCFIGFVGYPVVKTLFPGGLGWYYLENFCYCAIFLLVALIQHRLTGWEGRATTAFVLMGVFVCLCALLAPFFLADNLALMLAYSALLKVYTYAGALFLTVSTLRGIYRRTLYSAAMAAGMLVFDCALVFDRLFPHFEPMLFGWFREFAAGVLVALIGGLMCAHVARQYRQRLLLEGQMGYANRLLEVQRAHYPVLLEKEREIAAARHDLRHHFLMLRELAAQGNLTALSAYLDKYGLTYLQPGEVSYSRHFVSDMLLRLYAKRAAEGQVSFTATVKLPEELPVESVDLCVLLSNLLENAMEATAALPRGERWVSVGMGYRASRLSVTVDNSFDGRLERADGRLLSRKRAHAPGVGLRSVEAVAGRYQGSARFYPDESGRVFHSEVLLTARATEREGEDTVADCHL